MSLDWSNERYVRLYTRDTAEQLCWPWQARAIWPLLIRKADRSGMLPVSAKLGIRGLAALISIPVEVVEPGVIALLEDGCLRQIEGGGFVIPNYIEAQETPASDAKRQRDLRERRRANATAENHSDDYHAPSRAVAERHAPSRAVTPSLSDPILAEPNLADPDQPLSGLARAGARSHHAVPVPVPVPGASEVPLELKPDAPRPKPAKAKPTKHALPADWKPSEEHRALAKSLGVDVDAEAAKMRDHALARDERFANWGARFSGWLRRAAEYRQQDRSRAPPQGNRSAPLTGLDAFLALQAEENARR